MSALLDAHGLRHGDLYVIYPVTIPDRLEQAIGEAQRHDALNRILAEKMIDPENLILVQVRKNFRIQFARRLQVVAERFLDHNTAPAPVSLPSRAWAVQ